METGSKDSAYEKSEWKWKAKDWVNVEILMEPKDLKMALAEGSTVLKKGRSEDGHEGLG